jgi:hypothetical protein
MPDMMIEPDAARPGRKTPPRELYTRVRAHLARTPAAATRTRERSIWASLAIPLLVLAIVWLASDIVYGRPAVGLDVPGSSMLQLAIVLGSLIVLTIACTSIALWRGRTGLGATSLVLVAAAALFIPVYAALIALEPLHMHESVHWTGISPWGSRCFAIATLICTLTLAALAGALRRAVPVASHLRGGAIGAASGAWAGLALFAFCPSGDQGHLLVGHVGPVVLFTLIGFFALSRVLRP